MKKCTAKKGDYPCTIFGCPWCDECALYKPMKKNNIEFEKNCKLIWKALGFSGLKPYSKLYGTTNHTWGRADSNVWFISFICDTDNKIVSYEVNSTYFQPTLKQKENADKILKTF